MPEPIALVFPGQGSQFVGMGKELVEHSAAARRWLDWAEEIVAAPLVRLCLEGPEEELRETANAQPAILAVSVAAWDVLRRAMGPECTWTFAAGHSLGEFTALVAAGALGYEDAVRLVRRRGELMSAAGRLQPGAMAAVLGLDDAGVEAACAEARAAGTVVVANYNAAGQTVISGSPEAVARAGELAKVKGARKVVPLAVSGAFHSPLMEPAAREFAAAVDRCAIVDPRVPVVGNVDGLPLNTSDDVRAELKAQITSPVRWTGSVEYMAARGVGLFVEVGPGQVLSGLIKRHRALRTANVDGPAAAGALAAEYRSGS